MLLQSSAAPPARPVLLDSYQHLLLAALVGLLLCATVVPALAALLMALTQLWRMKVMRRAGLFVPMPQQRAAVHKAGYFDTAGLVARINGMALLLGIAAQVLLPTDGVAAAQLAMATAMVLDLYLLWSAFGVLRHSPGGECRRHQRSHAGWRQSQRKGAFRLKAP